MSLIVPPSQNTQPNSIRTEILTKAYESLGEREKVSVEEYAQIKNISREEASEFDLNDDGKISFSEEACRFLASFLFRDEMIPTMVLCRLHELFNFSKNPPETGEVQSSENKLNFLL